MRRCDQIPLYILPHGIIVTSEWIDEGYVKCGLVPHPLLKNKIKSNRSRVIMTAILGRILETEEHVHHGILGTQNDSVENLKILFRSEHIRMHSLGNKNWLNRKHSNATKKKMSIAGKGRTFTIESREKMSKSRTGKKASMEARRNISKAMKGRKFSKETIAKMRIAAVKRWVVRNASR